MMKTLATLGFLMLSGAVQAVDAGSPRTNYMLHCSGCHGIDGSGDPASGIPTMRNSLGHFLRVAGGREFLVQVPGTSQSALPDDAVAELLNWILKSFSAAQVPLDTRPYTMQEVAGLRSHPLDDVPAFRAAVVGRLKDIGIVIE